MYLRLKYCSARLRPSSKLRARNSSGVVSRTSGTAIWISFCPFAFLKDPVLTPSYRAGDLSHLRGTDTGLRNQRDGARLPPVSGRGHDAPPTRWAHRLVMPLGKLRMLESPSLSATRVSRHLSRRETLVRFRPVAGVWGAESTKESGFLEFRHSSRAHLARRCSVGTSGTRHRSR